jgi:hypothetical protein
MVETTSEPRFQTLPLLDVKGDFSQARLRFGQNIAYPELTFGLFGKQSA